MIYSPLKVFHHQDKLNDIKQGKQIVPLQVQLVLSDLCNQDCSFCAYRMSNYTSNQLFTKDAKISAIGTNNPIRMIPTKKAEEIVRDCKKMGVKAIQFTGGGEPTVHPDFGKIYSLCHQLGLETSLVTNGVLLNKFLPEILQSKWIRISIDAGSAETYSKIRRVSTDFYNKVWSNIKELVDQKISEDPVIGIGFVVTKENYHEVKEATKLAKKTGVDNIRISAVLQPDYEKYFAKFYKLAVKTCKHTEQYNTDKFKVFNLFGDRLEDLKQRSPEHPFCGYQQFHTYIGGDLNVYRCCVYSYNERGLIGSLKNQSFKDLWFSKDKQNKFNNFDARDCELCQFNNKNNTINYALSDNPPHVNFV